MKKIIKRSSCLLIFFLFSCCPPPPQHMRSGRVSQEQCIRAARQKLGPGLSVTVSPGGAYLLCRRQQKPDALLPDPPLTFYIWCCRTGSVMYKDETVNGTVFWLDEDRIRVETVPGVIKNDDRRRPAPSGYIYRLSTDTRLPLTDTDLPTIK